MTSEECAQSVRYLCGLWAEEHGVTVSPETQPSFAEFYSWLEAKHSARIAFLARAGVAYMIETWLNQTFKELPKEQARGRAH